MDILKRMEKIVLTDKPLTDKQLEELLRLASQLKTISKKRYTPTKGLQRSGEKLNSKQENRTERVEIRATPKGLDKAREIADKRGLTLSELIRERLPELENA